MKEVLVVGAGFAGAVISRELADAGMKVRVIDQRSHVGGNAYDYVNSSGERIHKYGPHLLHGDRANPAVAWLSRFTDWTPYEHRVRALLPDGRTTPLPVNRTTLEDVFECSLNSDQEAYEFLQTQIIKTEITNTDEFFLANVGPKLANLFFRPYTRKMWGLDPAFLEPSVGARLPVRLNRDDRYFTDSFQAMPSSGFTSMFENILSHSNIHVSLSHPYEKSMSKHFAHTFTSAPIDIHYDLIYGRLPYRSIKFEQSLHSKIQPAPVINFTDSNKYTRVTQWDLIANSNKRSDGLHTLTREIPCSPEENNFECYYPVRNIASIDLYAAYKKIANEDPGITFIGRTGLFLYIDMIPCVSAHIRIAQQFVKMAGTT